jgi:hypothetical protein
MTVPAVLGQTHMRVEDLTEQDPHASASPVITVTIPGTLTWEFTPHGREICTCSNRTSEVSSRLENAVASGTPIVPVQRTPFRGLATVDVRDFAGDPGIHPDSPAGVLDGQCAGDQSPSGSVVCPTSIR